MAHDVHASTVKCAVERNRIVTKRKYDNKHNSVNEQKAANDAKQSSVVN